MPMGVPLQSMLAVQPMWRRLELPTWILAITIYAGWLALTWFHRDLPWWLLLPGAAWIAAWHMSLQHEIVHGHPTRSRTVNTALGFPPLSLWLPFERYRTTHLAHHSDPVLTDPIDDPESAYVTAARWARLPQPARMLLQVNRTLAGRVLVGPLISIAAFLGHEIRILIAGDRYARHVWLAHLAAVVPVLVWVVGVCDMPLWQYAAFFVYPGLSLTLVRSFAEHRAALEPAHRTAIVERASLFGLLFLHNNLHVAHHRKPGLPWYALPAYYRANRAALVQRNHGLVYDGYLDVARRFLWVPHDTAIHPLRRD